MNSPVQAEMTDGRGNSRRQFLQQLASTTAVVTAAATLPAMAQQNAQQADAKRERSEAGSVAETLASFALSLRYEDLPARRNSPFSMRSAVGSAATRPDQAKLPSSWLPA
jgi:hypothetical protein